MEKKYYLGIDLGGTNIKLGIVDNRGRIITKLEAPTPLLDYERTLDLFIEMTKETGVSVDELIGIGIGVPGFVNVEEGSIANLVNVGWKNVRLKADMEEKFGLPVYVDNDANLAALGEMWQGAGIGLSNLICVTIGTGVGAGVIINSKIYHGKNAMAGEIGHLPINPRSTVKCNCGKFGCLETEVSATALINHGKNALVAGRKSILTKELTAKEIFDAAKLQDSLALEIINNAAYYLGLALAQLTTVIAPEKIILGGGVSKAKELLLEPTKKYFMDFSTARLAEQTELVLAKLGNDAGIIGAVLLAKMENKNGK